MRAIADLKDSDMGTLIYHEKINTDSHLPILQPLQIT